ncbi:hypothetical protein BLOT_014519 [Blomia tropicalis]|nr:hypothetical protein BLOT_014519 [Blomia tropicalis]
MYARDQRFKSFLVSTLDVICIECHVHYLYRIYHDIGQYQLGFQPLYELMAITHLMTIFIWSDSSKLINSLSILKVYLHFCFNFKFNILI